MKLTEVTQDRVVLYDAERHCMRVGTIASWQDVPLPRKRRKDAKVAQPDPRQVELESAIDTEVSSGVVVDWRKVQRPVAAQEGTKAIDHAIAVANAAVASPAEWQSQDPFRPAPGAPEFV